jgi:membrane protease YdiL (CAAX protease family)
LPSPEGGDAPSLSELSIAVWAVLTIIILGIFRITYPETGVRLLSISLPTASLVPRSLLHVILSSGIVLGAYHALSGARDKSAKMFASTLVIFVFATTYVNWTMSTGARNYIAFWADELPDHTRFLLLFDLTNGIWLGCVIPLVIVREACTATVDRLLHGSFFRAPGQLGVLVLLLIPVVFSLTLNALAQEARLGIDRLSLAWWGKKCGTLLIFTATYEEIAYRITLLGGLLGSLTIVARAVPNLRPWTAIAVSGIAFGLAHSNQGGLAVVNAFGVGLLYGWVLYRTGNIEAVIAAHVVLNALSLPWN